MKLCLLNPEANPSSTGLFVETSVACTWDWMTCWSVSQAPPQSYFNVGENKGSDSREGKFFTPQHWNKKKKAPRVDGGPWHGWAGHPRTRDRPSQSSPSHNTNNHGMCSTYLFRYSPFLEEKEVHNNSTTVQFKSIKCSILTLNLTLVIFCQRFLSCLIHGNNVVFSCNIFVLFPHNSPVKHPLPLHLIRWHTMGVICK